MQCLVICWQQVLYISLQPAFELNERDPRLLQPMPGLGFPTGVAIAGNQQLAIAFGPHLLSLAWCLLWE